MKRGDIVLFAQGKPRPGVIVQDDLIRTPVDILLCPLTSTIVEAPVYRLGIEPNAQNGLTADCQIMADKIGPVRKDRIDRIIGQLGELDMQRLERALMALLDLGD